MKCTWSGWRAAASRPRAAGALGAFILAPVLFVGACGELSQEKESDTISRGEVTKEKVDVATVGTATGSDILDLGGKAKLPVGVKIPAIPAVACAKLRSNRQLVSRIYQDVVNRSPTEEELKGVDDASFNYESWLETFLTSAKADDGYAKFITNVFTLSEIQPTDANDTVQVQLANDLKAEPVELIKRNKDKPWPWFWQTRTFYCNERTASLYGLTRLDTPTFVECTLPPERAGLLGLVSILRASSPVGNPQAFYKDNNNYGRVKNFVYWTKGIKLQAATNGPAGGGAIQPLQQCVPTTDVRIKRNDDNTPGLIYGTAAVPLSGSTCSGCHSKYNAPLSIAFRRFDSDGRLLDFAGIERLQNYDERKQGASKSFLKTLLAEQNSCWSPDLDAPPQPFVGLVGLADVAARSNQFGAALGVQVPAHLANTATDANMSATIAKTYYEEGQTLKAAFKGLFVSQSYRCEAKK